MTDKEIIIDGVNVARCMHLACGMCTTTRDSYGDCECRCDDYDMTNCYYKQLHRKEQELKNEKEAARNELEIYNQACLDLKNELEETEYKLWRLQAENEELKEKVEDFAKKYSKQYQINENKGYLKLEKELDRYKQALEEIKELINHCDNQDICTFCEYAKKCRDEYDYTLYSNHKPILTIINEVLKDE